MKFKHKATLLFCSLMISFVGAMPANAIICFSDSGSIKLELGYNGSCDCEEDIVEHVEHNTCEDSACSFVEIKADDCSDLEVISFESDVRSHALDLSSSKLLSLFNFKLRPGELTPISNQDLWPHTKPSLPPPHLRILSLTQVLI
jgi:hypothetical protein